MVSNGLISAVQSIARLVEVPLSKALKHCLLTIDSLDAAKGPHDAGVTEDFLKKHKNTICFLPSLMPSFSSNHVSCSVVARSHL